MKKLTISVIVMMLLAILASSCSLLESDGIIKSNPDGEKWSVFVYLCGTDLESQKGFMASINIDEMLKAEKSSNVNVIFQTGGTAKWSYDSINPAKLQRFAVEDGGFVMKDEQPLASMGQADTLGNYLKWGVETYPADKYMCLLWNHGGGSVSGVAFDELFESDSLNLDELSIGLSMSGVQFEVVGFDACLMSSIETASAIAPFARYMVASEEIEPGTGWDYTAWLSFLAKNTKGTGLELGTAICDSYLAKCKAGETDSIVTLAVTDLSQVPALVADFDALAAEMGGTTRNPGQLQTLSQAIVKAENYGGNNDNEGYTNMVDLSDLILLAKYALPEQSDKVLASLTNAVKYKISGSSRERSNGLSVFAPLSVREGELDEYAKIAVSGNYLRYLEGTSEWKAPTDLEIVLPVASDNAIGTKSVNISEFPVINSLKPSDFTVEFESYIKANDYYLEFKKGDDIVESIKYNLYFKDDDSKDLYYMGSDFDLNSNEAEGIYWSNLRNVWPIINGNTCSMIPVSFSDEYILYTIPILLNGEKTNLRMTYEYSTNAYTIDGSWDGIEASGMSSKEIRKLKDGDKIVFLFDYTDIDSNQTETFEFGGFTVDGTPVVEEAALFDSTFYYQFEITDIFGKTYQSDFVAISVKDGKHTILK